MGITVGAALKKVAAAILTEPKVLKNILFAMWTVARRTIWIWCSGPSLPTNPAGAMSWVPSDRC